MTIRSRTTLTITVIICGCTFEGVIYRRQPATRYRNNRSRQEPVYVTFANIHMKICKHRSVGRPRRPRVRLFSSFLHEKCAQERFRTTKGATRTISADGRQREGHDRENLRLARSIVSNLREEFSAVRLKCSKMLVYDCRCGKVLSIDWDSFRSKRSRNDFSIEILC